MHATCNNACSARAPAVASLVSWRSRERWKVQKRFSMFSVSCLRVSIVKNVRLCLEMESVSSLIGTWTRSLPVFICWNESYLTASNTLRKVILCTLWSALGAYQCLHGKVSQRWCALAVARIPPCFILICCPCKNNPPLLVSFKSMLDCDHALMSCLHYITLTEVRFLFRRL